MADVEVQGPQLKAGAIGFVDALVIGLAATSPAYSLAAVIGSLTALALLIASYYALTGIACAVYHRKRLLESPKNLLLIGVGPVLGAGLLIWLLRLSVRDMSDPANSYSGQSWLGVGPPLVIGVGIFLAGVVLMLFWRAQDGRYWAERAGLPDPDVVRGAKPPEADPDGLEG